MSLDARNMRDMLQILMQPMQPEAPLSDIEEELKALGMEPQKANHLMQRLTEALPLSTNNHTANDVMALTPTSVHACAEAANLTAADNNLLPICLGSTSRPFVFQTSLVPPPATLTTTPYPMAPFRVVPEGDSMPVKAEKGGVLQEVSGRLSTRRAAFTEYHPPATFDEDLRGNPLRSFNRLRHKVVKEVEDICGDLYPSEYERSVIFGGIQLWCGPPDNAPSWNYYWSHEGHSYMKKKHKGPAISDLEKARRYPSAYGCHGTAVDGELRPARPYRPYPGPAMSPSQTGPSPIPIGGGIKPPGGGGLGHGTLSTGAGGGPPPPPSAYASDLKDLSNEDELRDEAARLKEVVTKLQAMQADDKKRKADAKKATTAANAAAKKQATGKRGTRARGQENGKDNKDPNPLSEYEQERDKTKEANQQWLTFIEKTYAAQCKILNFEEADALIGVDKDRCVQQPIAPATGTTLPALTTPCNRLSSHSCLVSI